MADKIITCNAFKKAFEEIFGPCEWKAVKDEKIFQSEGWKDQKHRHEVKPSENHGMKK